ncbi:myosin-7B-like isoform X4 [Eriocheir sinensis]|uniref:myosin-7B-like isoform X4 n=1 Tax=Eriocheir sinensis TaxID=95602 RepID=UPI0021C71DF7|nr:myosin-7B-like isoform X4 [Eriocheir sinensis]
MSSMDVGDSLRYREAVARLKHLLYDEPEEPASPPHAPYPHYSAGEGGGGAWRWLLELLRHQENLIAQLEKENEFLKGEVVSVGEGLRTLAQDNQDLHRRLSTTLTQALEEGGSESTCSSPAPSPNAATATLIRQKEILQAEVARLEDALAAVSRREQEALARLSHALALAEHTHAQAAQVRASSESAVEKLSGELTAAQQEAGRLRGQLDEEEARRVREAAGREREARDAEDRIASLQAEREELEKRLARVREEAREGGRKVVFLESDLRTAEDARRRLEDQLEEQRSQTLDATARLDQILVTRSDEAAAGAARAKDLEERLDAAREDTARLLQAVTALAKGGGRPGELHSTDDVKSERLAAGQQLQEALEALHSRHEAEVAGVENAARDQSQATEALRQELAALREQLARDSETHREIHAQKAEEVAALRQELQKEREEVVRGKEQLRACGGLYQRAMDALKDKEAESAELLARVRVSQQEQHNLLQEAAMLRRVVSLATKPPPPLPPPPPPPLSSPPRTHTPHVSSAEQERVSGHLSPPQHPLQARRSEEPRDTREVEGIAKLASDELFRNISVSPGVTLFHLYQSP